MAYDPYAEGDNRNEIPQGQQAGAMAQPGYFNAGPLPAIGGAVFGDAPAARTYANSASFPEPSDPTGGPVTSLRYQPNFEGSGIGANPFSLVQTGRSDNPTVGNEGGVSALGRGYEAQIAVSPAELRSAGAGAAGAGVLYGNEGRGNGQPSGYPVGPLSAAVGIGRGANMPAPMIGTATNTQFPGAGVYNNPNEVEYARQNAAYRARDAQGVQEQNNRSLALGQAQQAGQDLEKAQGAQRVANWNAEMARTDVAGNIGGEGRYASADLAEKQALEAANPVAGAIGRREVAMGQLQGKRNYLDEFAKEQEALKEGQQATNRRDLTQAEIGERNARAAGLNVSTAQQKQVLDLRTQLAAEKDPKKAAMLQKQLYAIEGKVAQPKVAIIDSDTGAKDLMGQPIYKKTAINAETGEPIGGDTAATRGSHGQYPQVVPQAVAALKANATPERKAQFDQFYGPGAADAALK